MAQALIDTYNNLRKKITCHSREKVDLKSRINQARWIQSLNEQVAPHLRMHEVFMQQHCIAEMRMKDSVSEIEALLVPMRDERDRIYLELDQHNIEHPEDQVLKEADFAFFRWATENAKSVLRLAMAHANDIDIKYRKNSGDPIYHAVYQRLRNDAFAKVKDCEQSVADYEDELRQYEQLASQKI